jgi:hypothetical protein
VHALLSNKSVMSEFAYKGGGKNNGVSNSVAQSSTTDISAL